MALPHKEWRAYLDTILDEHMRNHVIVDFENYTITILGELFAQHLSPVSEYPPNAVYPLSLDPLQTLLERPDIRALKSSIPDGSFGIEEKWVAKREVMAYIKRVISSNPIKATDEKIGAKASLRSNTCWAEEVPEYSLPYMEPTVLSRVAMKQTPLTKSSTASRGQRQNVVSNSTNRRRIQQSRPFATASLGFKLRAIPMEEESVSAQDVERLITPKISIPRAALQDILAVRNAALHGVSGKTKEGNKKQSNSSAVMREFEELVAASSNTCMQERLSPPLFPRRGIVAKHRPKQTKAAELDALRGILELAVVHGDPEGRGTKDYIEEMKLVEGITPFSTLTAPSTPDLTNAETDELEDEDPNEVQIDELRMPSSPPISNKQLRGLFNSRMEEILLPRSEHPFQRRGPSQPKPDVLSGQKATLSGTIQDVLKIVPQPTKRTARDDTITPAIPPNHSTEEVTASVAELDAEMEVALKSLCQPVVGLHPLAIIAAERLEPPDGACLSVPALPPPTDNLAYLKLASLKQLGSPLDLTSLRDVLKQMELELNDQRAVAFLQPVLGFASLTLELSWAPFVYHGPKISHESLCSVRNEEFLAQNLEGADSHLVKALLENVEQVHGFDLATRSEPVAVEHCASMDESLVCQISEGTVWNWSNDDILLLTRREKQQVRGTEAMEIEDEGSPDEELMQSLESFEKEELTRTQEDMRNELEHPDNSNFREESLSSIKGSVYGIAAGTPQPFASEQEMEEDWLLAAESGSSHARESNDPPRPPGMDPPQELPPFSPVTLANEFQAEDVAAATSTLGRSEGAALSPSAPPVLSFASNVATGLQEYLAHRGAAKLQLPDAIVEEVYTYPAEVNSDLNILEQAPLEKFVPVSVPELWDILSTDVVIPNMWTKPERRHYYIASVPCLQRLALIRYLDEHCSVDLYEAPSVNGPDLVIDGFSAIKLVTVSDVVPSNIAVLTASIANLGYGFTRVLVVLETFPASRTTYSVAKLEQGEWPQLELMTATVVETCRRLRKQVEIAVGLLGASLDGENEWNLGNIDVHFVLSSSVLETARFIRTFGDMAEATTTDAEWGAMWESRDWLDSTPQLNQAVQLSDSKGMNLFAALRIAVEIELKEFIDLPLSTILRAVGGLLADERMSLFYAEVHAAMTREMAGQS